MSAMGGKRTLRPTTARRSPYLPNRQPYTDKNDHQSPVTELVE